MHELGNIQRAVNPWAVFNPWDTQEAQPTSKSSNESSRFHIYDDAAAATVNPWAVFNPWDTQDTQQNMGINTIIKNQIKAEAKKALQCQANLGSQRVLRLF
jgi:hypothetical protein